MCIQLIILGAIYKKKHEIYPFINLFSYLYRKKMKIAYIMYPGACYMGLGDGSKMQAEIWKNELVLKGHQVDSINPWCQYDWNSYDIIHVFGFGLWNYDMIHWGSHLNSKFVFSPIIDTNTPMWKYKLASHVGFDKLRLYSQNYMLRQLKKDILKFYARTHYEARYLIEGYGIPASKVTIIPLSYREDMRDISIKKEPFCLFVGTMTQERKNVMRLIDAAIKYNFKLILVGNTGNRESLLSLKNRINNHANIDIKGFVTNEELKILYNKAKAFALPSINEGVGLVALEAAVCQCNIVLTNIGGPKEYYPSGSVELVNPYDVDEIGSAILRAINDETKQPSLSNFIKSEYSSSLCGDRLIQSYQDIL
jgi:glycosyltransferase involved in cell wall biosynthesis